jgi:RecA/RadA recombinase
MIASGNIVELREWLSQRCPQVRLGIAKRKRAEPFVTGITALDSLLEGGLPRGGFTELVASGKGSGSAEVIHQLLCRVAGNQQFMVLVDGRGSFDVGAAEPEALRRLLWIRCPQAVDALKATDLLLRDRNFPFLVLDLKLNTARELGKISSSTWFRYARLVEQNQTTVLVITPQALVGIAVCRVAVESALGVDVLNQTRAEVLSCLRFRILRSLRESERAPMAQAG